MGDSQRIMTRIKSPFRKTKFEMPELKQAYIEGDIQKTHFKAANELVSTPIRNIDGIVE